MDTSSEEAFWGLLLAGSSRTVVEQGRLFAIMRAIWWHWNEVFFKGRTASMDGVVGDVEGFVGSKMATVGGGSGWRSCKYMSGFICTLLSYY